MTSERKKSIFILVVTLVMGILLGLLVPGFFSKWERHAKSGSHGHPQDYNHRKEWFAHMLNRVIQPDSAQAMKIRPITQWASGEIDSLESDSNRKMSLILDSVRSQLKPILTAAQQNSLDNFDAHAKKTWTGGDRRRH